MILNQIQTCLQLSARLYQHLTDIPHSDERDEYIEKVNKLLDERGSVIEWLRAHEFKVDPSNKVHHTLIELDNGIRERLHLVMADIKKDMRLLQETKKKEVQYMNPFSNIRVMDGMYYDKKK